MILHHWDVGPKTIYEARYLKSCVHGFGQNLVDELVRWQEQDNSILVQVQIQIRPIGEIQNVNCSAWWRCALHRMPFQFHIKYNLRTSFSHYLLRLRQPSPELPDSKKKMKKSVGCPFGEKHSFRITKHLVKDQALHWQRKSKTSFTYWRRVEKGTFVGPIFVLNLKSISVKSAPRPWKRQ